MYCIDINTFYNGIENNCPIKRNVGNDINKLKKRNVIKLVQKSI